MLICVWVLAQVSCYSANFNFTYEMQIGRIKNIPFIYKMIIEIVMAAAEMVLKASDMLILVFLMWRPVRPQKYNNKLCRCYFCSVLFFFFKQNHNSDGYAAFTVREESCYMVPFLFFFFFYISQNSQSLKRQWV